MTLCEVVALVLFPLHKRGAWVWGSLAHGHAVNKRQSCALSPGHHSRANDFNHQATRLCQINCQKWLWSLTVIFLFLFQANLDRKKEKFPKENPRSKFHTMSFEVRILKGNKYYHVNNQNRGYEVIYFFPTGMGGLRP